ncbi:hypothetical protein [Pontibacter arcticus]|uniref:hypothetical protein n=1 Tax=Pontibacter arcticus TaxID=2080288 RepID=UPI001403B4E7|nr:hypothetical protein [Pontibacter arcticus]
MTKGHNQEDERKNNPEAKNTQKNPGENRHLTDQDKDKSRQGRQADEDPSNGTKGKNSI